MIALLTTLVTSLGSLAAFQDPTVVGPPVASDAATATVRVRVDRVPGSNVVATWLVLRAGADHDPADSCGLMRTLAEVVRGAMPPAQPDRPVETIVLGDATLVGATGPADLLLPQLERIGGWLGGTPSLDDDALVRARGRALLRADDESVELPGPVLRDRLERLLVAGTPAARPSGGVPAEIRALTAAQLREAFAARFHPARALVVVVGDVPADVTDAMVQQKVTPPDRPCVDLAVTPPAADAEAAVAETVAARVDGPFVAYGIRAPVWGSAEYLPFLVAMEVVRSRAMATFRTFRGGEVAADFPWLSYDFTRMPALAVIQRRGKNGDPVASTRAEIASLVAGLRGGATEDEIGAATGSLLRTLEVPPFSAAMRDAIDRFPLLLHQRGAVIGLYDVHGWPTDLRAAIGSVLAGRVDEILRDAFADGRGAYVALRPAG